VLIPTDNMQQINEMMSNGIKYDLNINAVSNIIQAMQLLLTMPDAKEQKN
jgi:predicted ATP-dependent protease